MDSTIAQDILKWLLVSVAINTVALLGIAAMMIALTLHVTRATREITRGIDGIATMTRDVAAMTQEVLRRIEP